MKDIVIIANFCRDFSETDNGRFLYICKELAKDQNNKIEIITSDFSHGLKKHKKVLNHKWPFKITFLHEPGYDKNISLKRFYSHYKWGKEVAKYLESRAKPDVIYSAIPSLYGPFQAAKYCEKNDIKFIIDIQDLWPEAFKMVFNIPGISNLVFLPFKYLADSIYKRADTIIAVSKTYVDRAVSVNIKCDRRFSIYLGTNLESFDNNVKINLINDKLQDEIWLGYCGTLGASYDLICVIDSLAILRKRGIKIPKFIVMGDGPKRRVFEEYSNKLNIEVVFTGRLPYDVMCARLKACDIVVNPITKGAAQSIINKHADYAASGNPVLNTQECVEYRNLVDEYKMGFNCNTNDANDLADKLQILLNDRILLKQMGLNARKCAEEKFDRKNSYKQIIENIIYERII